ncbi:MAG: type I methionyl aminopeptidase [Kiritimatiellae bacterium]|nr:type I methionyl aminopeptidase [Kiritimatiellia bacterium]
MIKIKKTKELDHMRESAQVASTVLHAVKQKIAPGVSTGELDDYAYERIHALGAKSAFQGYRGYPANICTSVNDEVVHGIPGKRKIEIGDIVSIDAGVIYNGYVGDNATTVAVGVTDPKILRLLNVTEIALETAISKAVAGGRVSDISHAVEQVAIEAGFSVVRDFVGHGIGKDMHEDPQIPNFGPPGRGPKLKNGMTLALEPMVNVGQADVEVMSDGWTVLTKDRKYSAHFEHTVAIQNGKAEVLTRKKK